MATTVSKVAEQCALLAVRQGHFRKFNFGLWTEIKFGFYLSTVGTASSNAAQVAETVALATNHDRFTIGLKDDSLTDPGFAGSVFVGACNTNGVVMTTGTGGPGCIFNLVGFDGTTTVQDTSVNYGAPYFADPTGLTAYCGGIYCRMVINNRGLSTQTIGFQLTGEASIAGAVYTPTALRTKLVSLGSFGSTNTIAWNTGAAARTIPDCVWIRLPTFLNQFRISAMRIIKIA